MQNYFRLFISSTFGDFKKERDVLHKNVFPKINEYCNENGFVFQPIDLRWGVSNEAQLDQKTLEVCLEEVRACKHFPHPNFLVMAGDRYGYIPLPYMIEKTEFDKIKEILENDKEKILINYEEIKNEKSEILSQKISKNLTKLELLEEWYKLDENQIPVSFILKPRVDTYKEYINWEKDQEELRTILQYVANILFDDKENKEYLKYFTSATEAEVLEGILDYKDITPTQEKLIEDKFVENSKVDKEYVYGYIRTIQNPTEKYIDSTKDKEKENFLKQKAINFKTNLFNTLDKDKNILTSSYDSIELYEENQLKEFEEFIYEKLINAIETQKNKSNKISKIEQEILEQKKFKDDKQKGFIGRENILNKIEEYVLNYKTNEPLVIYGISGMGKSSLIAKSIDNVSKLIHKNGLIYRFVGATQNSTTIKTLLISICDELAAKNIIEKIDEYEYDEYKFFKHINEILSSIEKPIILFIDALDQFQSKDSLQWLPENLNENFKIVFSVLNDEKYKEDTHYYNILKNRVNSNNLIDISNDSLESSKELLIEKLLLDLNRKIDKYQTKYLLDKWKETNYSPLYLKIAIEEVKHWKSKDKTQKLESSVEGIIKEYIQNLSKIYHHEEILVNKVFGYIHASKDGLSEKELLEILSEDLEDESLIQNKIINKYHEPIKVKNLRRENKEELVLPMSIWSRLHTQIKPFIIERNIDNQPLMKFFHRQFTSVVDDLIKDNKIQLHTKLSSYFYTLQDKSKTWDERYHNLHMLSEYPYQLFYSKQSKELKKILFDLEFAGSIYDNNKQDGFKEILLKTTQLENITEDEIYPWESFYREKEHLIVKMNDEMWKSHQSLFQLAYEDGLDSPLTIVAEKLIEENKINFHWLKVINRAENFSRSGLLKVLEGHRASIYGVEILEDGRILSYSLDNTLRLWDKEGNLLKVLEESRGSINGVKILEDGNFFSFSNDGTLRLWDKDGNHLKALEGHNSSIFGVEILEDGKILSYSDDKTIRFWDKDGNHLKVLKGHSGSINGVKILENGRILSYSGDNTLRLWDKEGNILKVLEGHSGWINGVEILEDGRILSFSVDGYLILWDKDGNSLKNLDGHINTIIGVEILEDGRILSHSRDNTLRLWDKDGNILKVLKGHRDTISGIEILEDGRILSYSGDNTLRLWDKEGNILKVLEGHSGWINGVEILEDGRILSFSVDRYLILWDKDGNSLKNLDGHINTIIGVEILEDGRILSYSGDNTLRLWDKDGNSLKILNGHNDTITGVKILKDGKILSYSDDKTIRLWDIRKEKTSSEKLDIEYNLINGIEILKNGNILSYYHDGCLKLWNERGRSLKFLDGHSGGITGVKILKDGKILSYSRDNTLRLWDKDGNILKVLDVHNGSIKGVKILEDGRILSYSEYETILILWDKNGNISKIFYGHNGWIRGVEILEDGRILSYSRDNTLRLWDKDGNSLKVLEGHSGYINGVEVLKDGKILSYSEYENILRLWDKDGNSLKFLEGHSYWINGVKILEDGKILSYSWDKTLILWDKDGNILKVLEGHSGWTNGVKILEDGKILSYSEDRTLRLWDKEGNILKVLEGHSDSINGVKVLEDGKILSYSLDKTFRLWSSDGELIKTFYIPIEKIDKFIIKKDKRIVISGNRFFIYEDFTKIDNIDINTDKKYSIKQKSLEELITIDDISNEKFNIKIKLARLSNNINQLKQLSDEEDINIKLAVFKNPNSSVEIKEKLFKDKAVIDSLSMSYDTSVELLEQIADKFYENYHENLLNNPTVLEKTKNQLEKYKVATELNSEAISKNEDEEYEEEIKLYLKALEIVEELYNENQNRWIDFYTLVLNNLASVYYIDLDELEKAYEIYKKIESIKIGDLDLYNNLSAISSRLKIFDESEIYFKKYFDLFDINSIEEVENINEFIFPLVKYYQVFEILVKKDKLKELEQTTNKNIQILKNKFSDEYNNQIEEIHNSYLSLKESEDSFDNQKYEIFYKLFIESFK